MRALLQIKLPLILPIMVIALLFSMITMFGDMTVVYVLTRGGPVDYTRFWASTPSKSASKAAPGARRRHIALRLPPAAGDGQSSCCAPPAAPSAVMAALVWILHNFWSLLVALVLALIGLRIAWRFHKYGATRAEFIVYPAAQSLFIS